MKRFLIFLACLVLLALPAAAENSGFAGVWIENDGYGTLTLLDDGSALMEYYDGTVTATTWGLTDDGYRFGDGMWYNSPMVLLDDNTLSVSNGWMIFTRQGFMPTTDPTLLLGAIPVGEEGEPYLGTWNLTGLRIGGEEYDPALLNMTMTLTFFEDGTIVSDDGLEPYTTTWCVSYGYAVVEGDILGIDDSGLLVLEIEGDAMLFTRVVEEPAIIPAEAEGHANASIPDLPGNMLPFVGTWHMVYCHTGGLSGDLRTMGITGTLTLNADGTGRIIGIADESGIWYEEDGVIRFGESGMPMTLLGDPVQGESIFLQYGTPTGGYMIFSQNESALWDPPLPDTPKTPAAAALPTDTAAGSIRTDVKYTCTSFTSAGFTMDATTLGAEYALLFHENGTADFTVAGYTASGLPCTHVTGQYAIDYYGTQILCVPTDTGVDLDYFGAMTLHFVPAE